MIDNSARQRQPAQWNRTNSALFSAFMRFRRSRPNYFVSVGIVLVGVAIYPEIEVVSLGKIPNLDPTIRLISGIIGAPFIFLMLVTIDCVPSDDSPVITSHAIVPGLISVFVVLATLFSTVLAREPLPEVGWHSRVDGSLSAPRFENIDADFKELLDREVAYRLFQERLEQIPVNLPLGEDKDPPTSFLYIAKGGGRIVFDMADRIPYRVDPRVLNVALGWIMSDGSTDYHGMYICLKSECSFSMVAKRAAVFVYPLDNETKSILSRSPRI